MNLAREINRLPNDVKQIPKVRSEFRQRIIRELLSYLKVREAETSLSLCCWFSPPFFGLLVGNKVSVLLQNRQAMRLKEYEAAMASLDENRRVKDIILNSLPKEALEGEKEVK